MELDPGWAGPLIALGLAVLALLREALHTRAALVVERERQATVQEAIRRWAAGLEFVQQHGPDGRCEVEVRAAPPTPGAGR